MKKLDEIAEILALMGIRHRILSDKAENFISHKKMLKANRPEFAFNTILVIEEGIGLYGLEHYLYFQDGNFVASGIWN